MHHNRYEDINNHSHANSGSSNSTGNDRRTERGDHPEIEQPNPSIATPGIPDEMPAREIR